MHQRTGSQEKHPEERRGGQTTTRPQECVRVIERKSESTERGQLSSGMWADCTRLPVMEPIDHPFTNKKDDLSSFLFSRGSSISQFCRLSYCDVKPRDNLACPFRDAFALLYESVRLIEDIEDVLMIEISVLLLVKLL